MKTNYEKFLKIDIRIWGGPFSLWFTNIVNLVWNLRQTCAKNLGFVLLNYSQTIIHQLQILELGDKLICYLHICYATHHPFEKLKQIIKWSHGLNC